MRFLSWTVLCCFMVGCGKKTTERVFPESVQKPGAECTGQRIEGRFIVEWENGLNTVELAGDTESFLKNFVEPQIDSIRHIEFDKKISLQNRSRKLFDVSSVLRNTSSGAINWGEQRVQAEAAWEMGFKGQGVVVAVVDSVIDYSQPQLKTQLAANEKEINGIQGFDDDENGFVDDFYGWDFHKNRAETEITSSNQNHGSHVSGIILADPKEGEVVGVAPEAKLIPASFMKNDDEGGNLSDAIAAIKYAARRGARIINTSWGGGICSQALKQTMISMADRGVLFVVAAGNDGADLDQRSFFPASYALSNQINVAASNESERLTSFSNHSPSLVQLAAPGFDIWSTVPGGIQPESGTSMAAPFVAGAAAILLSAKPNATFAQIRNALIQGVDTDRNWGMRVESSGRLNVKKALDSLLSQ